MSSEQNDRYLAHNRDNIVHEVANLLYDRGYFRNCINCDHWQDGIAPGDSLHSPGAPEGCKLFKQLPPGRIIAKGCDKHSDLIPF